MITYLDLADIHHVHYDTMKKFDETDQAGVLFEDILLFAVDRPKMFSFGVEMYPTLWLKAAALIQSIAQGHPFNNGNKRTALGCLYVFLLVNEYDFMVPSQYAEDFMVHIITDEKYKGSSGVANIANVIKQYSKKIEDIETFFRGLK